MGVWGQLYPVSTNRKKIFFAYHPRCEHTIGFFIFAINLLLRYKCCKFFFLELMKLYTKWLEYLFFARWINTFWFNTCSTYHSLWFIMLEHILKIVFCTNHVTMKNSDEWISCHLDAHVICYGMPKNVSCCVIPYTQIIIQFDLCFKIIGSSICATIVKYNNLIAWIELSQASICHHCII